MIEPYMIYGALAVLVGGLSWASHDHVKLKLSAIELIAWTVSNLAIAVLGFSGAPLLIPSMAAVLATLVAWLGWHNRSATALVVFALYVVSGTVWVGLYVTHTEGSHFAYLASNVIFLARLLAVGGTSVADCLRHWTASSHQRAHFNRFGR